MTRYSQSIAKNIESAWFAIGALPRPVFACLVAVLWSLLPFAACAQSDQNVPEHSSAGYTPVLSGAFAYIQNTNGGVQSLVPQINPLLLVPMGHSVLLESRAEFTGFFQREDQTGPYAGKVLKTVDYAQLDWLADSHVMAAAGYYIIPFGLFSERESPVWIRNLQNDPITYAIATHPDGAADGFQLRGAAATLPFASIQYTAYVSAHSNVNELQSARSSGGDVSIYFPSPRFETGFSYRRTLEGNQINNEAAYLSWQPNSVPLDLKAEYDNNHYGQGYWIEAAHVPQHFFIAPDFFHHFQGVARMEQLVVRNGGGNGLATVNEERPVFALNYLIRDDWRFVANYGRLLTKNGNSNQWNFGFTYRFIWPLWPGKKS